MKNNTRRYRAQLPDRQSYKPVWRPQVRRRRRTLFVFRPKDFDLSQACAPEGAWLSARFPST